MARILYIPTGEYLKFYYANDNIYSFVELWEVDSEITYLLALNSSMFINSWLKLNNVILPILLSELEIIYD